MSKKYRDLRGSVSVEQAVLVAVFGLGVMGMSLLGSAFDGAIAGSGTPTSSSSSGFAVSREAASLDAARAAVAAEEAATAARLQRLSRMGPQLADTEAAFQRLSSGMKPAERTRVETLIATFREQAARPVRPHPKTSRAEVDRTTIAHLREARVILHQAAARVSVNDLQRAVGAYVEEALPKLQVEDPKRAANFARSLDDESLDRSGALLARGAGLFKGRAAAEGIVRNLVPKATSEEVTQIVTALSRFTRERDVVAALRQVYYDGLWHYANELRGAMYPNPATAAHSIDEIAEVLDAAGAIYAHAVKRRPASPRAFRSSALRDLATPTLAVARERIVAADRFIDVFGDLNGFKDLRRTYASALKHVQALERAKTLSFNDLHRVAQDVADLSSPNSHSDDQRGARHLREISQVWYPILSGDAFWNYRQVWDWRHALRTTIHLELPAKAKDARDPAAFFRHDANHGRIISRSFAEKGGRPKWRWIIAKYDALAKTNPSVAEELALPLGNYAWEAGIPYFVDYILPTFLKKGDHAFRSRGEIKTGHPDNQFHLSAEADAVLRDWATQWQARETKKN